MAPRTRTAIKLEKKKKQASSKNNAAGSSKHALDSSKIGPSIYQNKNIPGSQKKNLLTQSGITGNRTIQNLIQTAPQKEKDKNEDSAKKKEEKNYPFDVKQFNTWFTEATESYNAGNFRHAIHLWEKARHIQGLTNPGKKASLFNIARSNFHLKRYNTAIMYYEQRLKYGEDEEVKTLLETAKQKAGIETQTEDKENPETKKGAAAEKGQNGEYPFDVTKFNKYFSLGTNAYNQGSYRKAIIYWEKARQIPNLTDPGKIACLFNIARSNLRLKRYNTAIIYLETRMSIPSGADSETKKLLESTKQKIGIPTSETEASKTEQEKPDDKGKKLFEQAKALYQQGKYKEAGDVFDKMRNLPDASEKVIMFSTYNIGLCALKEKKYSTAITFLQAYLQWDKAFVEKAVSLLNQARIASKTSSNPSTEFADPEKVGKALFKIGSDYYAAGEYEKACQTFDQMRNIKNNTEKVILTSMFNMGLCMMKMKDFENALMFLKCYRMGSGVDVERADRLIAKIKKQTSEQGAKK